MKNAIVFATALAVTLIVSLPQPARAHDRTVHDVPAKIQVPEGNKMFLEGHAFGTQNYICLPSSAGFSWTLFGPQATLFNDDARQIITHFLSGNPAEGGLPRATWQHSRDTSSVWAQAIASSTDPAFVAPGAIPWLLLHFVGTQEGPTGGKTLTRTTYIQRVNTAGGIAPATGCALSTDVGKTALVPYVADYIFHRRGDNDADDDK
jgi:hypothetical protein